MSKDMDVAHVFSSQSSAENHNMRSFFICLQELQTLLRSLCALLRCLGPQVTEEANAACMQEWIADSEAIEEVQVMEEVPHGLRREISYSINHKVFEKLGIFHEGFSAQDQMAIAAAMTPMQVPAQIASHAQSCARYSGLFITPCV